MITRFDMSGGPIDMRSTTRLVVILLGMWVYLLLMGCGVKTPPQIDVSHPTFDMVNTINRGSQRKAVAFRVYVPYHVLNRAVLLRVTEVYEDFFTSSYRDLRGEDGLITYVVTFSLPQGSYRVEGILIRTGGDDKWYRGRLEIK